MRGSEIRRVLFSIAMIITTGVLFIMPPTITVNADHADAWSIEALSPECQANARELWDWGVTNGLTEEATAGIMGNCAAESGFDPKYKVLNEDGSYYHWSRKGVVQQYTGYFMMSYQWQVVQGCAEWCKSQGLDPNKISSQAAFVITSNSPLIDFNTRGGKFGVDAYKKMTDVEKATTEFCVCYENCFTSNTAYPDGGAYGRGWQHLGYRIKYAKHCFEYFTGTTPLSDKKEDKPKSAVYSGEDIVLLEESDFTERLQVGEYYIQLPTIDGLGIYERDSIYEWRTLANSRKWEKAHAIPRGIISFIGLVIIIYATLLYIAYWFDKTNNFIDISALTILSLGKLKISPDGEKTTYNTEDSVKVLVHKDIIFISLIGIGIGTLVTTGRIYDMIAYITALIEIIFAYFN